jgi:NADPH-dependent 2,4-dienoyl-CoA reductase/sulfur reductase-like enzyme/rhodanese-related sulfurtransferase
VKNNNKVLIIGGIAAGTSAAAKARRKSEEAEIVIYERDSYISYGTCGLPYLISGKIASYEKLLLNTVSSFEKRFNLKVNTMHEVLEINPLKKVIKIRNLKTGIEFFDTFDKLIITTGSFPVRLNLKGSDSPNVFVLKTLNDSIKIKDYINSIKSKKYKNATIIGGGFIGLELIDAFIEEGFKVNIIEKTNQMLPMFDSQIVEYIENYLIGNGINILKEDFATEIKTGMGQLVEEVFTNSGRVIKTDLLIYSIGAKPDTDLARRSGIKVNSTGEIIVNEKMETNYDFIYAAGDCCTCKFVVTGSQRSYNLASIANRQGRIAGYNAAGGKEIFEGSVVTSIIKILDFAIAKTGISLKDALNIGIPAGIIETHELSHAGYYPGGDMMHMILIYNKSNWQIIGFEVVGKSGVDKKADIMSVAIKAKLKVWELSNLDFGYHPAFSSAKDPINIIGMIGENLKKGEVSFIDVDEFKKAVSSGKKLQLIDVRTKKEYELGHIKGSINIHINALRDNFSLLDRQVPVVIYCTSSYRAYLGLRILVNNEFKDVKLLNGSYMSWERKI